MSDEITTAMVDTYNVGIEHLAQQKSSKLETRVRQEAKPGERNSFDQVGVIAMKERTVRNEDTKYINSPHRRRWVSTRDFSVADLVDPIDAYRILNDPGGAYAEAFVAAANRNRDAVIIQEALGTAYTGKAGTTAVTLPAAQIIVNGGTNFQLAKVREAMRRLIGANAIDPDQMMDLVTMCWTSAQMEFFLDVNEVKSHDYNTQKVLVKGSLGGDDQFYGFNYVNLEDWKDDVDGVTHQTLPKTGNIRTCVAFTKSGVLLNEPRKTGVQVDRLPSKNHATQIYKGQSLGATRMQETKVIALEVDETASS